MQIPSWDVRLPQCSRRVPTSLKLARPYQPSPQGLTGRPAHRPCRGLLRVHSCYGLSAYTVAYVIVIQGIQTFRHLHAYPGCFRLLPAGASRVDLSSTRKCRLCAKKAGIAIWALDSPTLFEHSAADLSLPTADRQIGCLNLGRVHFGRLVAKKHSAATNPSHRILLSHLLRPAKNGSLLVVMAPPLIIDDRRSLI